MTIAESLPLVESHVNPEIIFPEGQFWSDEPPLESNLHLQQIILLIRKFSKSAGRKAIA